MSKREGAVLLQYELTGSQALFNAKIGTYMYLNASKPVRKGDLLVTMLQWSLQTRHSLGDVQVLLERRTKLLLHVFPVECEKK